MKRLIFSGFIAIALLMSVNNLMAQNNQNPNCPNKGQKKMCQNLPDLTPEQQKKIDDESFNFRKDIQPIENQIAEKEAKLNTLRSADKADMTAINNTVSEIGLLKTEIAKKHELHLQNIRQILTPEQRLMFDSKPKHCMNNCKTNCEKGGGMHHGKHHSQYMN